MHDAFFHDQLEALLPFSDLSFTLHFRSDNWPKFQVS